MEPGGEARQTMLEHWEARSAAEIAALSPAKLVFELDLLFDQVLDKYGKYREAENELLATERLRQLARSMRTHAWPRA